ncbi:MAG TPA: hypothetical protein VK629_22020 [Steroidobacteraceae bacterium]|nr:hypothetical protein [Steroidobacteraceae bacterium]
MIDQARAKELAESHIATQDLKGLSHRFSGVNFLASQPDNWYVVFGLFNPNDSSVKGPMIVVVSKATGEIVKTM